MLIGFELFSVAVSLGVESTGDSLTIGALVAVDVGDVVVGDVAALGGSVVGVRGGNPEVLHSKTNLCCALASWLAYWRLVATTLLLPLFDFLEKL